MSPPVRTLDSHHQKDFPWHHAEKCTVSETIRCTKSRAGSCSGKNEPCQNSNGCARQSGKNRSERRETLQGRCTGKVQDRPGIIAEAVSGNEHYASLVATMRDDNSALKTWSIMSDAAKEEEANKRIYRDL